VTFDNYDLVHLFSGKMLFMTFLALLTVDHNLLLEPQENIRVI